MQAQEGVEAEWEMPDSFALLADNGQAAYARADRRVGSLPLPVLDATGRYCGSLLPSVRAGMADVNQVSSFVGTVVVEANVSLLNQRETVAWLIPTCLAMAVCEKPSVRKVTTCW